MNNLRELRTKRCLSQRDLAKEAELKPSTIYTLEKGKHHPQFVTIRKLAKALNVDVTELFFD
jgi:DNA-binding XRE family transcriptional regulator